MAEDELIERYAKELEERQLAPVVEFINTETKVDSKPAQEVEQAPRKFVVKRAKQIEDSLKEVERMTMQREDARSRDYEIAAHKARFMMKDLQPP